MPLPRLSASARWRLIFLLLAVSSVALVYAWPRQRLDPAPPTAQPSAISSVPAASLASETQIAAEPSVPAATERAAPQPPSPVTPHRAPASLRAADLERLARESDLSAFAAELQARADAGDADAAATLAELYRHCAEVLRYPVPPRSPEIARLRLAPFQDELRFQRCAGFGAAGELSSFNLQATARGWADTAARLGDPASILASRQPGYGFGDEPVDEAELRARAAAADLLLEGNFAALTRHGLTLADLSHHRMGQAWERTLCEMAGPCDRSVRNCPIFCDPRQLANELQGLSPRQRRELAGQQLQILQALQSGRFDGLWRQPVPAGGRQ